MSEPRGIEASLLAELDRRVREVSEVQHQLAREQRILTRARTELRMGRSGEAVLAEIREQSPDLLADYCDLRVRLAPPPLRPVPRTAASA